MSYFKVRLLLTSACTARCAYCHNEGQGNDKKLLSLNTIKKILAELVANNCVPNEFVLSGGEPTLHSHVAEIARLCQQTGAHVSMDSHAGHPELLAAALPFLNELKIHVDSFDAAEQFASMGIKLDDVLSSIQMAKMHPNLQLRINHPVQSEQAAVEFVAQARALDIDCKIIEMFGLGKASAPLHSINWGQYGYMRLRSGNWVHESGAHQLLTKRCDAEYNSSNTLFIGVEGVRRDLRDQYLGSADDFSVRMINARPSPLRIIARG